MAIPKMRTAAGCVAYLREQDPGNAISEHYIRRLIKTGAIPHVACGTKKLVDVDKLINYLEGEQTA